MGHRTASPAGLEPFLTGLRGLPFIRSVSYDPHGDEWRDGRLTIQAARGRFDLDVVRRPTFLDHGALHALTALARQGHRPLAVFARYVPRPAGERLIEAGINFVDESGNMHLALGPAYARTVLGRTQVRPATHATLVTPAQVQMLFLYASDPKALTRTVRTIAADAGISKSKAADLRRGFQISDKSAVHDLAARARDLRERLVSGYTNVLRPRLIRGRFRPPEHSTTEFLERLKEQPPTTPQVRFALTGAAAAVRLHPYYQAPEVTLFVEPWHADLPKTLRLLPDRQGPVTLLKAFGTLPYWRMLDGLHVAHPWLIYAELMQSDDPRAHEAAEELRHEHLTS